MMSAIVPRSAGCPNTSSALEYAKPRYCRALAMAPTLDRVYRGRNRMRRYRFSGAHDMANAAEIAYQLNLTETGKGGYTGFCPSCCYETGFSVIDKNGRTLFHCHAGGCTQQQLIQALGEYGLWGDQDPQSVHLPVEHPAPSRTAGSAT